MARGVAPGVPESGEAAGGETAGGETAGGYTPSGEAAGGEAVEGELDRWRVDVEVGVAAGFGFSALTSGSPTTTRHIHALLSAHTFGELREESISDTSSVTEPASSVMGPGRGAVGSMIEPFEL